MTEKVRTRTALDYSERYEDSGDDKVNININWENGDLHDLQMNLNRWLTTIGVPLKVVAVEPKDPF